MLTTPPIKPPIILDASIIAKYLLPQENLDAVIKALPPDYDFCAPSIACYEIPSLLTKHMRRGNLSKKTAKDAYQKWLDGITEEWIYIYEIEDYMQMAMDLSYNLKHHLYDCCYLALAIVNNAPLITSDKKLHARSQPLHSKLILVD